MTIFDQIVAKVVPVLRADKDCSEILDCNDRDATLNDLANWKCMYALEVFGSMMEEAQAGEKDVDQINALSALAKKHGSVMENLITRKALDVIFPLVDLAEAK
jgi:hypothetical protein